MSKTISILAVDDNRNTLEILKRTLEASVYKVTTLMNVGDAVDFLKTEHVDIIITDNKMPEVSGIEFVRYLREHLPDIGVLMITGYATIDGAVTAIQEGAHRYLSKPFTEEELLKNVSDIWSKISRQRIIRQPLTDQEIGIVGKSSKMLKLFRMIEKASMVDATVLVSGESGTGKELVARAIHYNHKQRSSFPFVAVNCPGIPSNLFESELFGHVKGAFTGAMLHKEGFFSASSQGTIFLDEISEIDLAMQAKLLRVLQEKEIHKVGSTKSEKINTRVIAATNKSLRDCVKSGSFREDLFFRLNVINIDIPPLRERKSDIYDLCRFFLRKYSGENLDINDDVLDVFSDYSWPGNIRELENVIQRCCAIVDSSTIRISDLPEHMKHSINLPDFSLVRLEDVERQHIQKVLDSVSGNKSKAAVLLGIDRKTLREKLK